MVLICIFLSISDTKMFMYIIAICMSSVEDGTQILSLFLVVTSCYVFMYSEF